MSITPQVRLSKSAFVFAVGMLTASIWAAERPNILIAISDDQSWPHAGAYGDNSVSTPHFDRLAREGVLFTHAFCHASQCSPSRAAFLTGRNIWQMREAGTHASLFPADLATYTDVLKDLGYFIGYTGKPWGPGSWKDGGRSENPCGTAYNESKLEPPTNSISDKDYAANFQAFLKDRPEGRPFHFWFGCHEPHRNFEAKSGFQAGKSIEELELPSYWPDEPSIRSDFLDYKREIDWFDYQLGKVLEVLEATGEAENTLVIVTSDNGMPFPRAKANAYDAGMRVPMAIRWPKRIGAGRTIDRLTSFIDIAPTLLDAVGVSDGFDATGGSLYPMLVDDESGSSHSGRGYVLLGKERHNYARPDNVGYPIRAIRTADYLYIRNLKPDRWPLGDPPWYLCHTKMDNPVKDRIIGLGPHRAAPSFYDMTYAKRPEQELYDVRSDPDNARNLASDPRYTNILEELDRALVDLLTEQGDPRMRGKGDVFESYPYYQRLPEEGFPGFKEYGVYNEAFTAGAGD